MKAEVNRVVNALSEKPVDLETLTKATLPKAGLYSWWEVGDALPSVPASSHPAQPELKLLYVGIGPKSASSAKTLASRLIGDHLQGNTGSSTLRLTLAAHLLDTLVLHPRATLKKVVLPTADNGQLTQWMRDYLRVVWVAHPSPWDVEAEVIAEMKPPLNIDDNRDHPHCATNQALRAAYKKRGRSSGRP